MSRLNLVVAAMVFSLAVFTAGCGTQTDTSLNGSAARDSSTVYPGGTAPVTQSDDYVFSTGAPDSSFRSDAESKGLTLDSISEARAELAFDPSGIDVFDDVESIVVNASINGPDGSVVRPKPLEERSIMLFRGNGTVITQLRADGFGDQSSFIKFEMAETGADQYKRLIDVGQARGIVYNRGMHELIGEDGMAMSIKLPSTMIVWFDNGIVTSIGSETAESYKELLNDAALIAAAQVK